MYKNLKTDVISAGVLMDQHDQPDLHMSGFKREA